MTRGWMGTRVAGAVLAGLVTVAGCHGDHPTAPPSASYNITPQTPDRQQVPAGSLLPTPLQVTVTDAARTPVRGVVVIFHPDSGSGSVSDTIAVSGLDGVASVDARLGSQTGTYTFIAYLVGQRARAVTFTAVATAPPHLAAAAPSSFTAGDTVTLHGSLFNTTLSGNDVYFGQARARIIAGEADSVLRVVVPACLPAGSIAVRVQVGSASTNTVTGTSTASTALVPLEPLQGLTVSGTELGSCLRLPGDSALYLLVPQYATAVVGRQFTPFTLGSSGTATADVALPPRMPYRGANLTQARFDVRLRELGQQIAPEAARSARLPVAPALEALTLGSTRQFRVLNTITGSAHTTVTAALRYIGQHILVYVDTRAPAGGFTTSDLEPYAKLFDQTFYDLDVQHFGAESDLDRNGHVIVLFTPVVNGMTPAAECSTMGFVTGFFYPSDLVLGASTAYSNHGEIFYSLVPDPQGTVSCAHSVDQVKHLVSPTFVHEFQHMISFNQHVLARGGNDESVWLNEGLSHIAEELASKYYEAKYPPPSGRSQPGQLFPDSSQDFIEGDLFNAAEYLAETDSTSVTSFDTANAGTLPERGAAWLFLRWLGDHEGDQIYSRLVQTSLTGIENVEAQSGETFPGLFGDFGIALWTDSIPGVPRDAVPERYRFTSRNLRAIYARLCSLGAGLARCPYPLALKPANYAGAVSGTMAQGTSDYFSLQTPSSSAAVALQFAPPGGGTFPSTLQSQLAIFRLPPP